jgi:hypothetical protein
VAETALVVVIPEVEALVAAWRHRFTPDGARGMPPHVTLLYPFADEAEVNDVLTDVEDALAPFAPDTLAGESAALGARAERIRSRLREAKIVRRARNDLPASTVDRLEALGLLCGTDERQARAELRELEESLAALEQLQAWVEEELAASAV